MNIVKIKKISPVDYGEFYIRRASLKMQTRIGNLIAALQVDESKSESDKMASLKVELVGHLLCDQAGNLTYPEGQYAELEDSDGAFIDAIVAEAKIFNNPAAILDAEIKNSDPSPSASSPSELHSDTAAGTPIGL